MARILDLYDRPPGDGRVICVDEFGPLNLQPPGRAGAGSPPGARDGYGPRSPAPTAYGTCSPRWTWPRARCSTGSATANAGRSSSDSSNRSGTSFPAGKLYIVCDNFSPHKKTQVTDWCQANDVELAFTPEQRLLAELDRMRVHRAALLHPRRQRLPQPRRPRGRDRQLHPLAQQARPTQATLRNRLQDPPTRLPTQRCLTRH